MKTSQLAATSAALFAIAPIAGFAQSRATIPTQPVGDLSAYPTIVQTGTKPTLTWGIVYPSTVGSVAVSSTMAPVRSAVSVF